jgi:hypothetical protein
MNKVILFGLIGLFLISSVTAIYIYNNKIPSRLELESLSLKYHSTIATNIETGETFIYDNNKYIPIEVN